MISNSTEFSENEKKGILENIGLPNRGKGRAKLTLDMFKRNAKNKANIEDIHNQLSIETSEYITESVYSDSKPKTKRRRGKKPQPKKIEDNVGGVKPLSPNQDKFSSSNQNQIKPKLKHKQSWEIKKDDSTSSAKRSPQDFFKPYAPVFKDLKSNTVETDPCPTQNLENNLTIMEANAEPIKNYLASDNLEGRLLKNKKVILSNSPNENQTSNSNEVIDENIYQIANFKIVLDKHAEAQNQGLVSFQKLGEQNADKEIFNRSGVISRQFHDKLYQNNSIEKVFAEDIGESRIKMKSSSKILYSVDSSKSENMKDSKDLDDSSSRERKKKSND